MVHASREIHLVSRPDGMPTEADFALVESDVADPGAGEVLVQNLYMSVDPAMRPRMTAGQALNEAMGGGAIGRVADITLDLLDTASPTEIAQTVHS